MPRPVSGRLITSDNDSMSGVTIQFKLLSSQAYTSSGSIISKTPITVMTDSNGDFSLTLFTESDFDTVSTKLIYSEIGYRMEIPSVGLARLFKVPDGSDTLSINLVETIT